jgi:hypothetical protein
LEKPSTTCEARSIYLIYDFACIANGFRHVPNTQFPICDSWAEFETQRTGRTRKGKKAVGRLSHVPEPIIDRLRQLQPCSTPPCKWTYNLRELSNPDKHRAHASIRITGEVVAGDHPDLASFLRPEDRTADKDHFVVGMFFKNTDIDVIEMLQVLQREVRALVEEFKPAFKRTGDVIEIDFEAR